MPFTVDEVVSKQNQKRKQCFMIVLHVTIFYGIISVFVLIPSGSEPFQEQSVFRQWIGMTPPKWNARYGTHGAGVLASPFGSAKPSQVKTRTRTRTPKLFQKYQSIASSS
jgi:hypothetical protein